MSISGLSIKIERKMFREESKAASIAFSILCVLMLIYAVYFSAYQIQLHRTFHTGLDLVSVEQPLWNTLHGRFMRATYYPVNGEIVTDFTARRTESLFGDHFQPSLLVLLPVYAIFPRSETLMIVLCITVALGALPLYSIANRRLKSPWQALLFSTGYLLLPAIQTLTSHDIHATAFIPTFVLAAFDMLERRKTVWFWVFVILAFGLREDIPIHLGWAFLIMAPKDERKKIITLLGIGIAWSLVSFLVIIPGFGGGGSPYLARYFPLGTELTPSGIWYVIQKWEFWKINITNFLLYNIRLGLPFLFIYFFYPRTLLAVIQLLVLNGFSWFMVTQYPNQAHYSSPVVPWLFIGAIEGYKRLVPIMHKFKKNYNWSGVTLVALLTGFVTSNFMNGYNPWAKDFYWPKFSGREDFIEKVIADIPSNGSISAECNIAAHLGRRETVRFFPDTNKVDWIIIDVWFGGYPIYQDFDGTLGVWYGFLNNPAWETFFAQEGIIVLKRGTGPPKNLEEAFLPGTQIKSKQLEISFTNSEDYIHMVGLYTHQLSSLSHALCLDWMVENNNSNRFPVVNVVGSRGISMSSVQMLDSFEFLPDIFSNPGLIRSCVQLFLPISDPDAVVEIQLHGFDEKFSINAFDLENTLSKSISIFENSILIKMDIFQLR